MMFLRAILATGILLCATAMSARVPENSWDSHIHIIDPERFALNADRDYTPKPATVANCTAFQTARGIKHAVIVLPSVYGTNNSILLDALKQFNGSYRGVAVVDTEKITDAELSELHNAGVRGVRVNMATESNTTKVVDAVRRNAAVARKNNWAVQVWIPLAAMVELHPIIPALNVSVVFDHFGHAEVGSKTGKPENTIDPHRSKGFRELIDLVQRKLVFVKISAPYQNSKQDPLYEDMRVVAEALITAGPDMVVYGSDWPHTASKEGNGPGGPLVPSDYRNINDAALVEITKDWCGSPAQIRRLFVDNPRRLWQWYTEN